MFGGGQGLLFSTCLLSLNPMLLAKQTSVAIIGSGIGGTSVAYYLSELLPGSEFDLTVFDSGKVGGRLATTKIAGREYETGGSIIHPANRLMEEHLERCKLSKAKSHEDGPFSLISKDEIIFQMSDGIFGKVKSVIRYGLFSLLKLDYFVGNLLDNFSSVYPKLESGHGYETVTDLLEAMSPVSKKGDGSKEMISLTKISIQDKLQELTISNELINEIGMVASKVNYGQFPDTLHGFVGSVSLAGIQGGLWNVKGGNYRIPECLLKKSGAKLVQSTVETVANVDSGYNVTHGTETELFDIVVLATPMTKDKTSLRLILNDEEVAFPGSFQRTLAYIIHGELSPRFGVEPDENLFFIDKEDVVASVSMLTPVDFDPATDSQIPHVFKLFSREEISRDELSKYFSTIHEVQTIDWLAYPDYSTFTKLDTFKLDTNLYYINNIEWAASAMEMSALAARNIANIISKEYIKPAKNDAKVNVEL